MILRRHLNFYIQIAVGIGFGGDVDGLKMRIGRNGTLLPGVGTAVDADIGTITTSVFTRGSGF